MLRISLVHKQFHGSLRTLVSKADKIKSQTIKKSQTHPTNSSHKEIEDDPAIASYLSNFNMISKATDFETKHTDIETLDPPTTDNKVKKSDWVKDKLNKKTSNIGIENNRTIQKLKSKSNDPNKSKNPQEERHMQINGKQLTKFLKNLNVQNNDLNDSTNKVYNNPSKKNTNRKKYASIPIS
ncbi:hypothetical protein WICMUC_002079 [Wickerhamomyces mucosus]|uniref:Uncharacterized protein n=1 Tax=Wickerhamomyces mucosus TaxID=1378264 RepID=A0A9P8PQH5_9ASCO|nr:hypothetical protein WICMUC_002079 [Wickerhamomyces mucosus]